MPLLTRRSLLAAGLTATVVSVAPAARAKSAESGGRKLVVVILRGAMDGMAALPKVDDREIEALRGSLVDAAATPLDNGFALHSAMPKLAAMYRAREAAFVPAIAGPYRERSHFEAQDLLECGEVSRVIDSGWLNRALEKAPGGYSAVSIGPSLPLVLRGPSSHATSWSPPVLPEASSDTVSRLLELYEGDALLKPALLSATGAEMVAGKADMVDQSGRRGGPAQYVSLFQAAGTFLSEPAGPEIAVVSLEGWDTHISQNALLKQRFAALDDGIAALKAALGAAWKKTAVVAVSEFGRTVRVNGGGGTDHGTGGLAMLAGGAIRGGQMFGDWPGLKQSALFENRDLMPAVDMRSVFKGLMRDHLGWAASDLDTSIFHASAAAKPLDGMI